MCSRSTGSEMASSLSSGQPMASISATRSCWSGNSSGEAFSRNRQGAGIRRSDATVRLDRHPLRVVGNRHQAGVQRNRGERTVYVEQPRGQGFQSRGPYPRSNLFRNSISLQDLLRSHNCPKEIDYLSIDTEGSGLASSAAEFEEYDSKMITVEHNFCVPDREQLKELLTGKGFVRLFELFSKFDDWYVKRSIVGRLAPRTRSSRTVCCQD